MISCETFTSFFLSVFVCVSILQVRTVAHFICPFREMGGGGGHKPVEQPQLNRPFIVFFYSFSNLPEKEANLHVELI